MKTVTIAIISFLITTSAFAHDSSKIKALEGKIKALEDRLAKLETSTAPAVAKVNAEEKKNEARTRARTRMRKDSEQYSREQLREIETLYQVANKKWRTQEGKDSLEKLIKKYDKANRTGCALLYLGQMSEGKEREEYLLKAIADFSDCFYGDGVQVGAYARLYLAYHYKEAGKADKSKKLFDEITTNYPYSVDHKGNLISEQIDK